MTAIEKIRKEIERRREANKRQYHSSAGDMSWQRMCGEEDCLVELLSFLDTIEGDQFRDSTKKIEPLERPYQDACSGLVLDIPEIVDKINEIIEYINSHD